MTTTMKKNEKNYHRRSRVGGNWRRGDEGDFEKEDVRLIGIRNRDFVNVY